MSKWTEEENRLIRKMRGSHTAEEIGVAVGRTANAVVQHAFVLKLPRLYRGRLPGGAKGNRVRGGKRGISVVFDPETFEEVKNVAEEDKLSFNAAVMQLVEWGLMERESNP